jgi:hypothetical protein
MGRLAGIGASGLDVQALQSSHDADHRQTREVSQLGSFGTVYLF